MAYTIQRIIDCMTQPNSPSGYYPQWGPINYSPNQNPAQQGNQWGSDQAGNPYTGSYAYINCKIRSNDPTLTGDGFSQTNLDALGYADSQNIMPYPWVDVDCAWQNHVTYNGVVTSNTSTNGRVNYKNFVHLTLLNDGTWVTSGSADMNSGTPGSYLNFTPGAAGGAETTLSFGSALNQLRYESGGNGVSLGAVCQQYPTNYAVWEAYPLGGYVQTKGYFKANVVGTLVYIEARTVLHNAGGTDDRNLMNCLIKIGADWTIQNTANLGEYMHSNWQLVSPDGSWNLYAATDIPAATLQANPPPGFGTAVTSPPPLPTLTGLPIYANWVLVGDWQGDSQPTPVVPASPSALSATTNLGVVTLVWQGTLVNNVGYAIQRSTASNSGFSTVATSYGDDIWTTTDSPGNGTWFYRVNAFNNNGSSAYSNVIQITVDVTVEAGPPGNPTQAPSSRLLPGRFRPILLPSGSGIGWV